MGFAGGRTTVTTAGTRVQLSSNIGKVGWVTVIALTENTNQINVGDITVVAATGATQRGAPLLAGDSITLYHVALTDMYIDSRVNGEGCTFLYGG